MNNTQLGILVSTLLICTGVLIFAFDGHKSFGYLLCLSGSFVAIINIILKGDKNL